MSVRVINFKELTLMFKKEKISIINSLNNIITIIETRVKTSYYLDQKLIRKQTLIKNFTLKVTDFSTIILLSQ